MCQNFGRVHTGSICFFSSEPPFSFLRIARDSVPHFPHSSPLTTFSLDSRHHPLRRHTHTFIHTNTHTIYTHTHLHTHLHTVMAPASTTASPPGSTRSPSPPPNAFHTTLLTTHQSSHAHHLKSRLSHVLSIVESGRESKEALCAVVNGILHDVNTGVVLPCGGYLSWLLSSSIGITSTHVGITSQTMAMVTRPGLVQYLHAAMDTLDACIPPKHPSVMVTYPASSPVDLLTLLKTRLHRLYQMVLDPCTGVEYRRRAILFIARDPRWGSLVRGNDGWRLGLERVMREVEAGRGGRAAEAVMGVMDVVEGLRKECVEKKEEEARLRCRVVSEGRYKGVRVSRAMTMTLW